MKRTTLFAFIAIAALIVACGNPSYAPETTSVCDTCVTESTEVIALDTIPTEDTTLVDTIISE